jgi:hypothetical protein
MYKFELEHASVHIYCKEKSICGLAEVLCPQITERLGPLIANPPFPEVEICGFAICGTFVKEKDRTFGDFSQWLHEPTSDKFVVFTQMENKGRPLDLLLSLTRRLLIK